MNPALPHGFEQIECALSDGVLQLTLNRPDQLNAFTGQMSAELVAALDYADADDAVRAVIVTGKGKAFCAGADLRSGGGVFDLKGGGDGGDDWPPDIGGLVTLRMFRSSKPIIGAINGHAVGVGITMALPMDIRLVSHSAKIAFPFAQRGIIPEAASSWFLPRLVGMSRALDWCVTGRFIPASELAEAGLATATHPQEEILPAAHAIAADIARRSAPCSIALTRQMLWRSFAQADPYQAHRLDSRLLSLRGRSPDAVEGVTSFMEKREPAFSGRISDQHPLMRELWPDL